MALESKLFAGLLKFSVVIVFLAAAAVVALDQADPYFPLRASCKVLPAVTKQARACRWFASERASASTKPLYAREPAA